MVKHTQTIRQLLATNCLSVFDHFVGLVPKGGFPLSEMNGDFAEKFIWACAFLFVCSLSGEIFLFKIVKMNLTNSRRKNSPQLLDQSKQVHFNLCIFNKYISIRSN